MDLSNIADAIGFADQRDTFKMPLKAPDGSALKRLDGIPFYIEVESSDMSEKVLANVREAFNLAKAAAKTGEEVADDFDENRAENMRFLAQLTVGWNMQNLKTGDEVPFSEDLAFEIYSGQKNAWLRKQVNAAVKNQANFFQTRSLVLSK